MIHNPQKAILHHYARAAALQEMEYRALLKRVANVASAADPDMTQHGFEAAMAALETILFERVDRREVPWPRRISARTYWRDRANQNRPGRINSRQFQRIMQLWTQLGEWMSDAQRTPAYFAGIVAKATGRTLGISALTSADAAHVIEALQARLSAAIRRANKPAALPF